MADRKSRRNRLVAVRLSEEEYALLTRCAASGKVPVPVSTCIRDLIRNANNPMHERETLAAIRKMQADLSFCLGLLKKEDISDEVGMLIRLLTEISGHLEKLADTGGAPWRLQN